MQQVDLSTYRALFPFLSSGNVYLNHAAISPLSTRVTEAVDAYLTLRSAGSVDPYAMLFSIATETKERIGTLINAPADRIAFVDNTSNGLNILASGLAWNAGDRVLLNEMEFPANVYPFLNLRRRCVEVDFCKCPDGILTAEMVERAFTPNTKLVSLSFVQFLNGFKADLPSIGELCKRQGVIFCVDAIQGLGAAPLDVQASHIDFLSNGGHKWLMAQEGLGFIYITNELQARVHQQYAGWTSMLNPLENLFHYALEFAPDARRYENGTLNTAGIIALNEAVKLLLEIGIDRIHNHLLSLTDQLLDFLTGQRATVITPGDRRYRAGIMTWKDPRAQKIFAHLLQRNIHVSLREGCIRVAPHLYNTHDEISKLTDALKTVLD